jgi:hypothetical protein
VNLKKQFENRSIVMGAANVLFVFLILSLVMRWRRNR